LYMRIILTKLVSMRRAVAVVLLAVLVGGCSGGDDEGSQRSAGVTRVRVVASFYPLYEMARRVGGERSEVANLTPVGVEPHDLELSPAQVDRIQDADLVLYLGQGFQPALERVVKRAKGKAVDLLVSAPLVEEADGSDAHVWLDPVLMGRLVEEVESAFSQVDAADRAAFAANGAAYRTELTALDSDFRAGLSGCARRLIVTSHEAFGYLARRYGLEQKAIAGVSPESEPAPQHLAELADLVRRSGTTTVFSEELVSPKVAETLAREAGVATAVLNPVEGLSEDQRGSGTTYLSVMRDNLATLKIALGCPG
jgi:zinc transport system substrate-binding protein